MREPGARYRPQSTRLAAWDYTSPGWYFVTICTRGAALFCGDVDGAEVRLSAAGRVVAEEWTKTPAIRRNVRLDAWVLMPNHLHGIIILEKPTVETPRRGVYGGAAREPAVRAPDHGPYLPVREARLMPNSLGSIVGQFKSACTRRVREETGLRAFGWQPRFYDHVIRSQRSLDKIRAYIRDNPLKWELERANPEGLFM